MSHFLDSARSIEIINSNLIKKEDLGIEHIQIGSLWDISLIQNLLSKDGVFSNYWVITKNIGVQSSYELYCGENVPYAIGVITPQPQVIFLIVNNNFAGILIDKSIKDLINIGKYGIYSWLKHIRFASSGSSVSSASPSAYIMSGNQMISVAPGTRMHHVNHLTGQITEIKVGEQIYVPNPLPGIVNISQFQRGDVAANIRAIAQQDQIMGLMNAPGVSLGSIGRNLHHLRFG